MPIPDFVKVVVGILVIDFQGNILYELGLVSKICFSSISDVTQLSTIFHFRVTIKEKRNDVTELRGEAVVDLNEKEFT
jgi:hypothetical protein